MIGILYESGEWSDYHLAAEVAARGVDVRLVNMEHAEAEREALACDMLASRVFASAQFRGHAASLARYPQVAARAEASGIVLVNPARAHAFEASKRATAEALTAAGLFAPTVFACATAGELTEMLGGGPATGGRAAAAPDGAAPKTAAHGGGGSADAAGGDALPFPFPCIVKPHCGGRTTYTALAHRAREVCAFLQNVPPDLLMVAQSYAAPAHGFLTRVEVVGGRCALVVKRSVAENGLSGYHQGSTYTMYANCPRKVRDAVEQAAALLGIELGSFDVVETAEGPCIIDANSVSNVSPDCTELFGMDLMAKHADYLAERHCDVMRRRGVAE